MNIKNSRKIFLNTGVFFLGLVSFYLLILKPISIKHTRTLDKIEKKESLLYRYKAILEQKDQLKKRITFVKNESEKLDKFLLTGNKPSIATSELQVLLENIAKKTNVTVKNVTNKRPHEKGIFFQIPLEIAIESTLRELKDVIYHIENLDKLILIRKINIRLIKSDNPEKLESKLLIDGYIKKTSSTNKSKNKL